MAFSLGKAEWPSGYRQNTGIGVLLQHLPSPYRPGMRRFLFFRIVIDESQEGIDLLIDSVQCFDSIAIEGEDI